MNDIPVCKNPDCLDMILAVDGYCSSDCRKEHKQLLKWSRGQ